MFNSYPNNVGYGVPNYNQSTYMPRTYAPTQYPQQMQMQPQMQMQVQPQPQAQQPIQYEMPIQYVGNGTLKETEAYILFPNQKAFFIDKGNGMVYEKVCGGDGQSSITSYKRLENKTENQAVEAQKQDSTIDLSDYVKKDDLDKFVSLKQYNEVLYKLEQLQKQIMGVKQGGTSKQ